MKVIDCDQRTDVWFLARCGFFTSSHGHEVMARGRGVYESTSRAKYRRQVASEHLTGVPAPPTFAPTRAMLRGVEKEQDALAAYAAHTGQTLRRCGFVAHDTLRAGCSLDAYVGEFEGVVEAKVPNTATHLRYLLTRRIPRAYILQVTHHLWITGAAWCDFVSFDDRLPASMQLLVIRVTRDQVDLAGYEREARRFLAEVDEIVQPLRALTPVEFFKRAPVDIARHVMSLCLQAVDARKHERPGAVVRRVAAWQPQLVLREARS